MFLSHAASDKALVDDLKWLIQTAVGLAPSEFFYSSGMGTGIPAGRSFVEHIRDEMAGSTFVVAVMTPAFRESEFCLAELGAVWLAADKDFYPVCVPEIDRAELKATLTGLQVERVDDGPVLANLLQRICEHFEKPYNAAACSAAIEDFLATLPARLSGLAGPTTVSADELDSARATIERLGQQVTEARDQLAASRQLVEDIKSAKTLEEIEELELPDETEEQIEYLIARVRDAVLRLDMSVRQVLPYAAKAQGMPWPDHGSWERTDIQAEVDKGYLNDGDDGYVYLNTDWPDIETAVDAVRDLQQRLQTFTQDDERRFRATYRVPADVSQTAVFHELF